MKAFLLAAATLSLAIPRLFAEPNIQTQTITLPGGGQGTVTIVTSGGGSAHAQAAAGGVQLTADAPSGAKGGPAEKIPFLGLAGVPVGPDLAHHLRLPSGVYLSVAAVQPDSPADKAGLKLHDILTHLDDQLLINQPQLQQLVRMKKAGDTVTVKILREGKELAIKATLGEREFVAEEAGPPAMPGWGASPDPFWGGGPDDLHEQMRRMQERMRRNFPGQGWRGLPGPDDEDDAPGQGQTQIQTFSSSSKSVSISNEKGKFSFEEKDGKKRFKAEDPDGKVLFDGDVNTEEDRKKVPADLEDMLHQMESGNMNGIQLRINPGKRAPRPGSGQKGQAI